MHHLENTEQRAELIEQITRLKCFDNIDRVSTIEQGDSHHCFKVVDQNKCYFVKYFDHIEHSHQYNQLNKIVADIGLAPALIYNDKFWQVHQFIEGSSLNLWPLSLKEKVEHCLTLMVACHQKIDVTKLTQVPVLNFFEVIKPLTKHLTNDQQSLINKIIDMLNNTLLISPSVLCHGDINFSNIILANKPWLLDFECACIADKEFDLAMMLSVNELLSEATPSVIDSSIDYYNERSSANSIIDKEKVMRYLVFSFIINGLWYFESYNNKKDSRLKHKAFKQFNYFDSVDFITESLTDRMR